MTSTLLQIVSVSGLVLAIALLVYGAWLCLAVPPKAPRPKAAAPENAAAADRPAGTPDGGAWDGTSSRRTTASPAPTS
jgi:hypothetical protein